MTIAISIVLLVFAALLVLLVVLQQGKERNLSGAISGSSESYYGKNKSKSNDKLLSRLTLILAILFAVIVLVLYIVQDVQTPDDYIDDKYNQVQTTTTAA